MRQAKKGPGVGNGAADFSVLYLITGFNRIWRTSANREWRGLLQEWAGLK
jgi:hypothetical protein